MSAYGGKIREGWYIHAASQECNNQASFDLVVGLQTQDCRKWDQQHGDIGQDVRKTTPLEVCTDAQTVTTWDGIPELIDGITLEYSGEDVDNCCQNGDNGDGVARPYCESRAEHEQVELQNGQLRQCNGDAVQARKNQVDELQIQDHNLWCVE